MAHLKATRGPISIPPDTPVSSLPSDLSALCQLQQLQITSLKHQLVEKTKQVQDLVRLIKTHEKLIPEAVKEISALAGWSSKEGTHESEFWGSTETDHCSFQDVASTGLWILDSSLRKAAASPVKLTKVYVDRLRKRENIDSIMSRNTAITDDSESLFPPLPLISRRPGKKTVSGRTLMSVLEGRDLKQSSRTNSIEDSFTRRQISVVKSRYSRRKSKSMMQAQLSRE